MEKSNTLVEKAIKQEEKRLGIVMKHMAAGVVFTDWKNAYIDEEVKIGKNTVVEPNVIITGNTIIGENCHIGFNSKIKNSTIGDGVDIESSFILESEIKDRAHIGPFAYIRPGCVIGEDTKIGDFVEVKNSTFGKNSKASHLTYIGDADIGESVNLGCGVVFVNYDGQNKSRSTVGDGSFIGCNSNLISPVSLGEDVYVAAGTTVTNDVPDGALCIGRVKNETKTGWVGKRGILKKNR